MKKLRIGAAIIIAVLMVTCVQAADLVVTRVYLLRGLGGLLFSNAMDQIGEQIRTHGAIVMVGGWMQGPSFAADAATHPHDRIVFVGHSMGAKAAADAANALAAKGIKAKVVGIDPLCTAPSVVRGVNAVNFYSTPCGFITGQMAGAVNVNVASYGDSHLSIATDPRVQGRVIGAALAH